MKWCSSKLCQGLIRNYDLLLLLRPNIIHAPPLSTVFWIIISLPHILHPSDPPYATGQLNWTALLHRTFPLYSGLGSTVHLDISHSIRPLPPAPEILFLSALYLLPSVPLCPWIPAPRDRFWCLCYRPFTTPFLPSMWQVSLSEPVCYPFCRSIIPP